MKSRKCIIYNRDFYLIISLLMFIYREIILSQNILLINKIICYTVGPVFTFCLMTYLELTVFHYTENWKGYQKIVQWVLICGIPFMWLFLCVFSKNTTLLVGGKAPYFALISAAYSIILFYFFEKGR